MSLELAACTDGDMDRAFVIVSDAFGQEYPYINYVFPKHETLAGRRTGGNRLRALKNGDPNTTYLKITDTETGVMTAVAKWNIYDGIIPDEASLEGEFWDTETEKKLAQEIFAGYLTPRGKAIKNAVGKIVCLDMMVVDPDYQRRGAGRMLARWGTEIADQMGVKTVVEATRQGRGLYASEGFLVEIEHYVVQLSDAFSERDTQSFTWMIRPEKSQVA